MEIVSHTLSSNLCGRARLSSLTSLVWRTMNFNQKYPQNSISAFGIRVYRVFGS